jgi:glycosyltransferase involved in cell wall biosynthesis
MRIALITPYYLPIIGGSELYVHDLALFLHNRGHEVTILTTDVYAPENASLVFNKKNESVRVIRFKVATYSRKLARLFISMYIPKECIERKIESMNFDILHFHNLADLTFPVALWRSKCTKLITCHTLFEVTNYHHLAGPRLFYFKKVLKHVNALHVLSQRDRITLMHLGIRQGIVVIPPGISVDDFYASPYRGGNKLLFVGRISPEKGLETLLYALSQIRSDCELLIVGPIQNRKYYTWLRSEFSKEFKGRVRMVGALNREELIEAYANADVFVFPSRMESFGMVLMEAMASRLPIVSTNVGVARELIIEGENGFVVSVNDWRAMARQIELLLADGNLRRVMGDNNRNLAEKRFRSEDNFCKLLELYRDITGLDSCK